MNLADWLLEQIAADEEVARELQAAYERDEVRPPRGPKGLHFAAMVVPARVLAECAAKRAIVEECVEQVADEVTSGAVLGSRTLRLLAQLYRDRAGYRQEWDVQ